EVGEAHIHVHLGNGAQPPAISGPRGIDLAWRGAGKGFEADDHFKGRKLSGALSIGAMATGPINVFRHSSGDAFFEINDTVAPTDAQPASGEVLLFWDSSRSRRGKDLRAEIALAAAYVDAVHPTTLILVTFADRVSGTAIMHSPTGAQVTAALNSVDYRGATSMAPLRQAAPLVPCLLFSDGNMTVDPHDTGSIPCTLFAVSGTADADRGFLAALARNSGGEFVDLRTQDARTALATLTSRAPRVAAVLDGAGHPVLFETLPANGNRIRLVGPLPAQGGIVVKLSQAAAPERHYPVDRFEAVRSDALGALWASGRDKELNATDRPDRDAMLALERRY